VICWFVALLTGAIGFHLGYRFGHQLGFDEGVTYKSRQDFLDRQDHRVGFEEEGE
jgi:hypothetical protein